MGTRRYSPTLKMESQIQSPWPMIRHDPGTKVTTSPPLFSPLSHESMLVLEIPMGGMAASEVTVSVVAVLPLGKITIYLSLSDRHRLENGFSPGLNSKPPEECAAITLRRRKRKRRGGERTALFNPKRQSRTSRRASEGEKGSTNLAVGDHAGSAPLFFGNKSERNRALFYLATDIWVWLWFWSA